eukprot:1157213-Pelagomonas_calceolata.AAC.7
MPKRSVGGKGRNATFQGWPNCRHTDAPHKTGWYAEFRPDASERKNTQEKRMLDGQPTAQC